MKCHHTEKLNKLHLSLIYENIRTNRPIRVTPNRLINTKIRINKRNLKNSANFNVMNNLKIDYLKPIHPKAGFKHLMAFI